MPPEVQKLAETLLKDPVRVSVTPEVMTVEKIEQRVELVDTGAKRARLAELIGDPEVDRVIVFARTKRGADRVAQNLGKDGIAAESNHGNKAQNARQRALNAFRSGQVRVLVATDIVARGIDVPGVTHIINYDLPDEAESYVHRIGRTGRNGAAGTAITMCANDEIKKLRAVEKITRTTLLEFAQASEGPRARGAAKPQGAPAKPGENGPRSARARSRRPRKTQRAA